ncbi:hypothetical protein PYW08_000711 [Mythimna loreyi]|uniref:Uncharacterized protein n=1 Tax=Mythimna loreyi TaxID=667449 RepID=A0ACC2QZB3_9NEOP|nr:hypothetical protein PYW08_000711 [Mythimna loreyi]
MKRNTLNLGHQQMNQAGSENTRSKRVLPECNLNNYNFDDVSNDQYEVCEDCKQRGWSVGWKHSSDVGPSFNMEYVVGVAEINSSPVNSQQHEQTAINSSCQQSLVQRLWGHLQSIVAAHMNSCPRCNSKPPFRRVVDSVSQDSILSFLSSGTSPPSLNSKQSSQICMTSCCKARSSCPGIPSTCLSARSFCPQASSTLQRNETSSSKDLPSRPNLTTCEQDGCSHLKITVPISDKPGIKCIAIGRNAKPSFQLTNCPRTTLSTIKGPTYSNDENTKCSNPKPSCSNPECSNVECSNAKRFSSKTESPDVISLNTEWPHVNLCSRHSDSPNLYGTNVECSHAKPLSLNAKTSCSLNKNPYIDSEWVTTKPSWANAKWPNTKPSWPNGERPNITPSWPNAECPEVKASYPILECPIKPTCPNPECPNVKPKVPNPECPNVKPKCPNPECPNHKPSYPNPESPKVKPTCPNPQCPNVKAKCPNPECPNVKPACPNPKCPNVKPTCPNVECSENKPKCPNPECPKVKPPGPNFEYANVKPTYPNAQWSNFKPTFLNAEWPNTISECSKAERPNVKPPCANPKCPNVKPTCPNVECSENKPKCPNPECPKVKPPCPNFGYPNVKPTHPNAEWSNFKPTFLKAEWPNTIPDCSNAERPNVKPPCPNPKCPNVTPTCPNVECSENKPKCPNPECPKVKPPCPNFGYPNVKPTHPNDEWSNFKPPYLKPEWSNTNSGCSSAECPNVKPFNVKAEWPIINSSRVNAESPNAIPPCPNAVPICSHSKSKLYHSFSNDSLSSNCKENLVELAKAYLQKMTSAHKMRCPRCSKQTNSNSQVETVTTYLRNMMEQAWNYLNSDTSSKKSCNQQCVISNYSKISKGTPCPINSSCCCATSHQQSQKTQPFNCTCFPKTNVCPIKASICPRAVTSPPNCNPTTCAKPLICLKNCDSQDSISVTHKSKELGTHEHKSCHTPCCKRNSQGVQPSFNISDTSVWSLSSETRPCHVKPPQSVEELKASVTGVDKPSRNLVGCEILDFRSTIKYTKPGEQDIPVSTDKPTPCLDLTTEQIKQRHDPPSKDTIHSKEFLCDCEKTSSLCVDPEEPSCKEETGGCLKSESLYEALIDEEFGSMSRKKMRIKELNNKALNSFKKSKSLTCVDSIQPDRKDCNSQEKEAPGKSPHNYRYYY